MQTVWIVEGDDLDFDGGDRWIVGVYANEKLANQAKARDWLKYWIEHCSTENLKYIVKEWPIQEED